VLLPLFAVMYLHIVPPLPGITAIQRMESSKTLHIVFRLTAGLWLTALLLGCAGQQTKLGAIPPLLDQPAYTVNHEEIIGVSPEMEQFLARYVPAGLTNKDRTWALAHAVLDPMLLGFRYNPARTLTAEAAFELKTGNCLAFSNMLVALARQAGMEAWYQEVEIAPTWSAEEDILVLSKHVNVIIRSGSWEYVLDVSGRKQGKFNRVRKLRDSEAAAQYFNNLGVDALFEGDLPRAWAYFAESIQTSPDLAYVWSNLGVALNRNGQSEDAKTVYRHALQLNSDENIATNNLIMIYHEEENFAAAEALERKLEQHRRRNPYYLMELANEAAAEERYRESIKLLHQSIDLKEKEYQFHLALARSLRLLGKPAAAQQSIERARELAPGPEEIDAEDLADLFGYQPTGN
jgi:Flp pilus assembly protein TadD